MAAHNYFYGEDKAPKVRQDQEGLELAPAGLEVVPREYPREYPQEYPREYPLDLSPKHDYSTKSPVEWTATTQWTASGWSDSEHGTQARAAETAPAPAPAPPGKDERKRQRKLICGLTVPVFWALLVFLVVVLAAGIGGGIAGGIAVQRNADSSSPTGANGTSTTPSSATSSPTASSSAAASSATADATTPTDGGCWGIDGKTYMPYAVDGSDIPLEAGLAGQQFEQQCGTNWVSSDSTGTHDIMRIFMPTLETCIETCAEYNAGYRASVQAGVAVGGGYCRAVSITKAQAGFCLLKNGTGTNDTSGQPDRYSSAVLTTLISGDI
ncbi:Uu.00g026590.m01.CDS01 [Anthostomella pinea]|uniref:Uu.00g026590.m01.CDS01 n=1 Tax=Anthostomella pinea TaxID=933095 RepID=A0AAI8V7J6_9PEZI|nr:Uu.00g026590.m01.CDS01 [Anthostomella pinea]